MRDDLLGDAIESLAAMSAAAGPDGPEEPCTVEQTPFSPKATTKVTHMATFGGDQYRFTFLNGYGASVIRHAGSYGSELGLWELAVLGKNGHLTYRTLITDDVIGYLTEADVSKLLDDIAALPVDK